MKANNKLREDVYYYSISAMPCEFYLDRFPNEQALNAASELRL
jgi:hypothetical protein